MKPYLDKEKIINWFMENTPEDFLLARLNEGQEIDENSYYDTSWIEEYHGREVSIDEDGFTLRISEKKDNRLGDGYESIVTLRVIQPEEDAFIIWK